MRKIIDIVFGTLSALNYLSIMLALIIYTFSVIGMNLLKDGYTDYYTPDNVPRSELYSIPLFYLFGIFE